MFSTQKLLDEMDQLTMEELQEFEQSYEQFPEKKQDQSETHPSSDKTKEIAKKGHKLTETKEEKSRKSKGSIEEAIEEVHDQPMVTDKKTSKEKETVMKHKQQINEEIVLESEDQMIDQLRFEIKELILENEGLQADKNQLKQQQEAQQQANQLIEKNLELSQEKKKAHEQAIEEQKKYAETLQATINKLEEERNIAKEQWTQEKQSYENQLAELIQLKDKEFIGQEQIIVELTRQLKEQEQQASKASMNEFSEEIAVFQEMIDALKEENAALQVENEQFQTEISEVLVFARKKANRTIQEAKIESERMVRMTEMRIDAIHDRAKEILLEVNETKESVIGLFDDLHNQVHQLSDKELFFEELEK